ncbi:MAG: imidazoleglycerol-phosphate dehydratase [Spirochaetaceae bacterium]|jgi:imidazoleglycerol-phosphate dehydratase|nr:imidazoleglycerol-phosphate dehydratase [Spirochaetaceae bacterium]
MERKAELSRKTTETDICVKLCLDGSGNAILDVPIGFFRHLLHNFARHGLFDLEIHAKGDLEVDQHHLVEDVGICLGTAFAKALGSKVGIRRTGSCIYPMDETLVRAACDISGRPFLVFEAALSGHPFVSADGGGNSAPFQTDTVYDFWQGWTNSCGAALHLDVLRGRSDHHKLEALFKAAGRCIRAACEPDPRAGDAIPSTKGTLENNGIFLC